MQKFVISIEESVVDEFEVMAESEEEALEIARKKYRKGDFVLEPGEVQYKQMAVIEPREETIEWIEF